MWLASVAPGIRQGHRRVPDIARPDGVEPPAQREDRPAARPPGGVGELDADRPTGTGRDDPRARPAPLGSPLIRGGMPAARPATSGSSAIVRALRPLKRKVPSWREEELVFDAEATAERAVQDGLWLPITRPASQRWLDLTVIVDSSPSMSLWRRQVAAFLSMVERLGAFRRTQVRLLTCHRG